MARFEAYHGCTAQQHQEAFDRLSRQSFRMISLNVYGDPADARYNAVWIERPGPGFLAFHGVRDADFQSRFDAAVASGHAPVLVTATGAGSAGTFAAVFEQGVPGPWMARHGLTRAALEAENVRATQGGMVLRSMSMYGAIGDARYAAVWHARRAGVAAHLRSHVPAPAYQAVFDAETSLPFFRPSTLVVGEDQALAAVFANDVVGRWSAHHGLTADDYQRVFDSNVANGLMPLCVSAGGTGSAARFAAIFAEQDRALAREWSAIGALPSALVPADALVEAFMKRHSVRSAQLSLVQNATVRLERAYTWSEPGTRRAAATDRMLLASCSKIFVTAAVQWLYDQRTGPGGAALLRPNDAVFPLLGFAGAMDPRSDTITIQQLLDHRGGYANVPSDATYDMRNIARDLGLTQAPTPTEVARRIYTSRNLANAPGMVYSYSNIGYLVASLVVERVSGLGFFAFVRQRLLDPLGISEVAICPTAGPGGRPADQVVPEDDAIGLTPLAPQTDVEVPAVFGGDQMAKESALGTCALASSATALARLIGTHAVWGNGGRMAGRRYGSTPGAQSAAVSRTDGRDWALILNTRMNFGDADWNTLIDQLDAVMGA
jgi:CubicO group peptidase (beta-lactamase class C family)